MLRVGREANNPTPSKIFDTILLPKPRNGNHAVTKTLAKEFGFGCRNRRTGEGLQKIAMPGGRGQDSSWAAAPYKKKNINNAP